MKRIINSLLDVDFYKFTMGQVVYLFYRDVPVRYALTNRTRSVNLADHIDEADLRRELDHVRTLHFTSAELQYSREINKGQDRMFQEEYLQFLAELQLPDYRLEKIDGHYVLEFSGKWSEAIYWETIALAIVNELYFRSLMKGFSKFERETVLAEGTLRLASKIEILKKHPDITITDFGTRRRFSYSWQNYVVRVLAAELLPSQFLGTSNTKLAMEHGVLPMGTSAHEMFMVMSGIMHSSDEEIRNSHNQVLQDWWDIYGQELSIALTDTFGSEFFFADMTKEQAENWKGLRQDSGDPFEFGERAIRFYEGYDIDPREKLIIFSDGLELPRIIELAKRFNGRIKVSFGWGTNLTNDLGFNPLSLVIKIEEANGHRTVKLSDNPAKAIGLPGNVERFKKIFGYEEHKYTEVTY